MSVIKKVFSFVLIAIMLVGVSACIPSNAQCEVVSAEYVNGIPMSGGLTVNYEGFDTFEVIINVQAADKLMTENLKGDEFRQAVYKSVSKGCSLTCNGTEAELKYGFWPSTASTYMASEIKMFFLVPEGTDAKDLTFKLDGAVLGNPDYQFTYTPE